MYMAMESNIFTDKTGNLRLKPEPQTPARDPVKQAPLKSWQHLAWAIARPIGIGVGGSLLVVLFLTTFLHVYTAAHFIVWIIAFNGAVSGYALAEKTRQIRLIKLFSAIIGAAIAMITSAVLVVLSYIHLGESVISTGDIIYYSIGGVIGSELGTMLGVKYLNIKTGNLQKEE